jgi:hypothetical protein
MNGLRKRIGRWRHAAAERKRRETQARRAKTYVVRDGRGRVISSH